MTGGMGFIGSTLVDYLINNDIEVFVIDDMSTGKEVNRNSLANYLPIGVDALNPGDALCAFEYVMSGPRHWGKEFCL